MGKEEFDKALRTLRRIPEDCKDKCSPDKIKDNYRYCVDNCAVLTEDLNNIIDTLHRARDWIQDITVKYNLDPKYVYELDSYLLYLTKVSTGDIILPEHHNRVVDTLYKIRDILEKIEGEVYNSGYQEGYTEGYNEGYLKGMEAGYSECLNVYRIKTKVSYSRNRFDFPVDIKDIEQEIHLETTVRVNKETFSINIGEEIGIKTSVTYEKTE